MNNIFDFTHYIKNNSRHERMTPVPVIIFLFDYEFIHKLLSHAQTHVVSRVGKVY